MERTNDGFYKWLKIIGLTITLIITVSSVTANMVLRGKFTELESRANENKSNIAELKKCYEDTKDKLADMKLQLAVITSQQQDVIKGIEKLDKKIERYK